MRPKVTKFIFGSITDISVSRIACSEKNILSIIGLFNMKR